MALIRIIEQVSNIFNAQCFNTIALPEGTKYLMNYTPFYKRDVLGTFFLFLLNYEEWHSNIKMSFMFKILYKVSYFKIYFNVKYPGSFCIIISVYDNIRINCSIPLDVYKDSLNVFVDFVV